MQPSRRQQGSVLVVCLVMLMLVTLFALSSVGSSVANLRIVGNSQSLKTLEYGAVQAVEQAISTLATFQSPANQTVTVNGQPVAVTAATCLTAMPASGYSALYALSPEDTHWEVQASATDTVTGANVAMTQGVKVRLNAGWCT